MISLASVTSPKPATVSATEDRYSTAFPLYEEADLVVRSADGTLFATQKLYLQAISPVFTDTLKVGSFSASEKRNARPVLRLAESLEDVELLLRLAQRDRYAVNGQELELNLKAVRRASLLADKYDLAPVVQDYLFGYLLPTFLPHWGEAEKVASSRGVSVMPVFALACVHRREAVIKEALRAMDFWGPHESGASVLSHDDTSDPAKQKSGWRYYGLGDMDLELARRVPLGYLLQFAKLQNKVLTREDYSFPNAADDWKVSSSLRTLVPTSSDLTSPSSLADVTPSCSIPSCRGKRITYTSLPHTILCPPSCSVPHFCPATHNSSAALLCFASFALARFLWFACSVLSSCFPLPCSSPCSTFPSSSA